MNVLIVGYGRMGHEVETVLTARGHQVSARIDKTPGVGDSTEISSEILRSSQAVIEFSLPEGVIDHVRKYAAAGLPAVVGTTGWDDRKPEAKTIVEGYQAALIQGSNFSLGAHMFFDLVERAATLIADLPDYDIMVTEWHHRLKKDSPSGTALITADRILRNLPRKTSVNTGRIDRAIRDDELHVASVRGGWIPGIHQVQLDSASDTIEIQHTVRNRSGLALGSVLAAEWLATRPQAGYLDVEEFARQYFAGLGRQGEKR
jgi:4-hydroxy-tetrahydrodipicolinate reductase